jgi:hypothetical protein
LQHATLGHETTASNKFVLPNHDGQPSKVHESRNEFDEPSKPELNKPHRSLAFTVPNEGHAQPITTTQSKGSDVDRPALKVTPFRAGSKC